MMFFFLKESMLFKPIFIFLKLIFLVLKKNRDPMELLPFVNLLLILKS